MVNINITSLRVVLLIFPIIILIAGCVTNQIDDQKMGVASQKFLFKFYIKETKEKIDGRVYLDEQFLGVTENGELRINRSNLHSGTIRLKGSYNGKQFEFRWDLKKEDLEYFRELECYVSKKDINYLFTKPVDLREKLWRYNLKYALEVALSSEELSKIGSLANELKGNNIQKSAWNILKWEDMNIHYDYSKANLPMPKIWYTENPYSGEIIDVEIQGDLNSSYHYQTPYETVIGKRGVCSDYAILTAGLLMAMNYSPVYIFHVNYENNSISHAFAAIEVEGQYFILDQHPPVWDLGRYYRYSANSSTLGTIKNATVYAVYRGDGFARAEKIDELTAEDFVKEHYHINSGDLEEIQELLSNKIGKEFKLRKSYALHDLDKQEYLPPRYKYGVTWTISFSSGYYHPVFKNCFADYVMDYLRNSSKIMSDIHRCDEFWIRVDGDNDSIVIKLMLGDRS